MQTARTLQPGQNIAKVGRQGGKKANLIIVIEVCKSVASVSKMKPAGLYRHNGTVSK